MEVIWTPRAEKELRAAIAYRREMAGIRSAERMLARIGKASLLLSTHPHLGFVEPQLTGEPEGFRALAVLRRYKIIYYIDRQTLYIASLFDCRRHPGRIMR